MADQDIFIENALPSDSNIAQALDALACVSLLVGVVDLFVRPSLAAVILIAIVPAAVAASAYSLRRWTVKNAVISARDAMNETYAVTEERLKILHSQINADVLAAVQLLKGRSMSGVELVERELSRTVPRAVLLGAMKVLLQTLKGATPTPPSDTTASGSAEPSTPKISVSTPPMVPTPVPQPPS
jgi:hypothetical protein